MIKLHMLRPKLFFLERVAPKVMQWDKLSYYTLRKNVIEATVLTENAKGEIVFILRIPLILFDYLFSYLLNCVTVQYSINVKVSL
jgi:hypothetical protein